MSQIPCQQNFWWKFEIAMFSQFSRLKQLLHTAQQVEWRGKSKKRKDINFSLPKIFWVLNMGVKFFLGQNLFEPVIH